MRMKILLSYFSWDEKQREQEGNHFRLREEWSQERNQSKVLEDLCRSALWVCDHFADKRVRHCSASEVETAKLHAQ